MVQLDSERVQYTVLMDSQKFILLVLTVLLHDHPSPPYGVNSQKCKKTVQSDEKCAGEQG